MIFRVILIGILLIMIGRFVFRFLLPIFRITMVTKNKMKEMQQKMEDMHNQNKKRERDSRTIDGEYIDYEEVK